VIRKGAPVEVIFVTTTLGWCNWWPLVTGAPPGWWSSRAGCLPIRGAAIRVIHLLSAGPNPPCEWGALLASHLFAPLWAPLGDTGMPSPLL